MKYFFVISLVMLSLIFTQASAEKYAITYKGIKAGEADFSVTQTGNSYQTKLVLYPVLLAKLSGIDDLVESSVGDIRNGHFFPNSYNRKRGNGNIMMHVSFVNQLAEVTKGEAVKKIAIAELGKDPLSQIAQIQYDLSHERLQNNYYLVTDDEQRKYSVTRAGQQVILTESPSKRRQFILSFDSRHVLVKLQKNKEGKPQFVAQRK